MKGNKLQVYFWGGSIPDHKTFNNNDNKKCHFIIQYDSVTAG